MKIVQRQYDALIKAPCFKCASPPNDIRQSKGVYLISENGLPLYVGRSNKLGTRLRGHAQRSHYTATFAFLLARKETGKKPTYKPEGSRANLLKNDPHFSDVFDRARGRIKQMDVQIVEESDPTRQALLEIYTAFVTEAPYNSFDNH